jgi:hypothetical protein
MNNPARRLDRLEQHTREYDLNATIVSVAAHAGVSPQELMCEAQAIAERAQSIGYDAALEELAHAAGTTVAVLRGEAARIGMEMATL